MNPTEAQSFLKEGESEVEKVLDLKADNGGEMKKISDSQWVFESPDGDFSSTASGWPSINIKSSSPPCNLSAEEQATVAVLHLQHNALEACKKFLVGNAGSDCDEDESDDEDDDELIDDDYSEECAEYKFFERVFAEDGELRRYYESNHREGDFYCLVCGGIGKKVWKRFKNCSALLHHSTSIVRTTRKRAHRAYAQVICEVIGVDIDQLPVIVLKGLVPSLAVSEKLLEPHESLVSDAEWAFESPGGGLSSTASGWASFNTKPSSHICTLSAEEQATVAVLHLQHKALEACRKFLVGKAGSDCDEGENDDEDEDESDDEDEDELIDDDYSEECEEYKFFERVFAEDSELRRYYENNHKGGDFYCLVCGGIRKKMWKRFKNCSALIQHSTAILRTTRKRAHRAYSQVICKIVGLDIDQLPAIVSKGLDLSLADSEKHLVEPKLAAVSTIDDSNDEPDKHDDHVDASDLTQ